MKGDTMRFNRRLGAALLLAFLFTACSPSGQAPIKDLPESGDNTQKSTNDNNTNTVEGGLEHPWLLIRSKEDLARLQSWATPSNPMWQAILDIKNGYNGKKGADYYILQLAHFDTDQPQVETNEANPNCQFPPKAYCDGGGPKGAANLTEQYALFYAFLSLMEKGDTPESLQRKDEYGKLARNIYMWLVHEGLKGIVSDQVLTPFRNRIFFRYNRATEHGEAHGLTVDWAYKYFSKQDLNDIHRYLLQAEDILVKDGLGSTLWLDLKGNLGNLGNEQMVNDKVRSRWAAENYPAGTAKDILFNFLALKNAPVDAVPGLGTLWDHIDSYSQFIEGALQLRNYGFFVQGQGHGGLMPEGPYGYGILTANALSLYRLGALTAQSVNAYSFPAPLGDYLANDFWEHLVDGFIYGMANAPFGDNSKYPGSGQRYLVATYNQSSDASLDDSISNAAGAIALSELLLKDQDPAHFQRYKKALWLMANGPWGGAEKLYQRLRQNGIGPSGHLNATSIILHFLAFDPSIDPQNSKLLADPRPAMPLDFYDPAQGRAISRTGWDANASWFGSLCTYNSIDHITGENGSFFLGVGSSIVTNSTAGYTTNTEIDKPQYNNTLGLQNLGDPKITLYPDVFKEGGQQYGYGTGDPVAEADFSQDFSYTQCDMTNSYNEANSAANAVTHASRSLLWLKPAGPSASNYVVIYDRASTSAPNLFKRFYLIFYPSDAPWTPAFVGTTLVGSTANGQVKYYLQTLLPNTPSTSVSLTQMPGEGGAARAVDDPMVKVDPQTFQATWGKSFRAEDTSNPMNIRFLHVLQAGPGAPIQAPLNLLTSSAASTVAFEGAQIGPVAALFRKDITQPLPANLLLSYTAFNSLQGQVISGLEPNAAYYYQVSGNAVKISSASFAGASMANADAGGVLQIGDVTLP